MVLKCIPIYRAQYLGTPEKIEELIKELNKKNK